MRQLQRMIRLAVTVGLVLGFTSSVVTAQEASKFAVINVVQLLEESDPGRQGIEDLKTLQKTKTDERNALRATIQELRTKISEGQFSLSEDKLAELQKQLEDKGIELQRFNDDTSRELQTRQEQMLTNIQELVMPIINQVGQEFGYTMIFNKFESGLVYASDAIDITAEVMKRLNDHAAAEGAPAEDSSSGS